MEKITLQHNLCSLYGLCPSIYEYLTAPEKNQTHITMWLRCAGELKFKKKKIIFQDITDAKMHLLQNKY